MGQPPAVVPPAPLPSGRCILGVTLEGQDFLIEVDLPELVIPTTSTPTLRFAVLYTGDGEAPRLEAVWDEIKEENPVVQLAPAYRALAERGFTPIMGNQIGMLHALTVALIQQIDKNYAR